MSLSVVPLFTGAIPWLTPTTPSILILSPTRNHNNFKFNNEIIKETTDEIIAAHHSVPMFTRPSDEVGPSP